MVLQMSGFKVLVGHTQLVFSTTWRQREQQMLLSLRAPACSSLPTPNALRHPWLLEATGKFICTQTECMETNMKIQPRRGTYCRLYPHLVYHSHQPNQGCSPLWLHA